MRRPPAGVIATVSAIIVYFLAAGTEILLIERLRPTELELTWISDGILALAFGSALFLWLNLKWTRLTLSHLEREHIVLETQLSLAADIQRGLLPPVPSDAEGVRWAARLEQAGRIGGDLYDFVRPDARSWLVLVGDVSGKGIPAALVLASIRTMFRMMTGDTNDPAQLVERISQRLYEDHGGMPYFTCVIVKINLDTHELAYVNAGHPSGLVLDGSDQKRTPLVLESCGPPAGMFPGQKYQTTSLSLPRGAMSILVTDGITEAFDVLGVSETNPIVSLVAQANTADTLGPVATMTPTFTGFPSGATSGNFDGTFDFLLNTTYRGGWLADSGGTPELAALALITGIAEGRAYLNIHTSNFPGGEIRGFLQPQPAAVPEPASLLLLGSGLAAAAAHRRRQRRGPHSA